MSYSSRIVHEISEVLKHLAYENSTTQSKGKPIQPIAFAARVPLATICVWVITAPEDVSVEDWLLETDGRLEEVAMGLAVLSIPPLGVDGTILVVASLALDMNRLWFLLLSAGLRGLQ